jgi:hypothetical protein
VAKLDRLSRDVAFVSTLMAQRFPFIVAELASTPIRSCCTFSAREAAAIGREAQSIDADHFAANDMPKVESIRATVIIDLRGISKALNDRGVRIARGGR